MKLSISRHLKKIFKTLSIMLIGLSFVLISSLLILLGTDRGFRFLMATASEMSSETLKFSQIEGNLLDTFSISDLQYTDAAIDVSIHHILFNWYPLELFKRQLVIHSIEINGIAFKQLITPAETKESETDDKQAAIQLPAFSLPVDILLQKLHITDINIISQPDVEAVHIDNIKLRTELIKTQLNIQELTFNMPEVQALIYGRATLQNNYPLTLQSSIKLNLPEQPELALKGDISGNLEQLTIRQQITGMLDASVSTQVSHLLAKTNWQSDIELTRFELSPYLPENNEIVTAQIKAKGDLTQAEAQISTQIISDKAVAEQAEITLNADISFAEQHFNTSGQWQNLQWPLSGAAVFSAKTGSLKLSGTPEDYVLTLQLALSGSDLPAGDWQAAASGGLSQINIDSLQGSTLNGKVDIKGAVSWGDSTRWQATLQTRNIDPGQFVEQWPGSIDINLHSEGQLSAEQLKAHILLEQFSGQLREQPLAGSGEFKLLNQTIDIKQFKLSSGDAKLEAAGKLDEQIDLNWLLDIKQLSDLLPYSQGSIKGQGHIAGTMKQPEVKARLKLTNIIYDTIKLTLADLNVDIHTDPLLNSNLDLSAQGLSLDPNNTISKINLSLKGPLQNHRVKLYAEHDLAALSLDSAGQLDIEQLSWNGKIKQLIIDSRDLGKWVQTKPADLLASNDKILLSSLCLKEELKEPSGTLCSRVNWTPEQGQARIDLNKLSFAHAAPYLPEEITQLTGALNLSADINLAPQILAEIKAEIKPGEIIFQPIGEKPVQLTHRNGLLNIQYDAKQLKADLNINLGPHTLGGNLNIPRSAIEKDPLTAPMKGHAKLDIKDLTIMSALVPQINEVDGHLLADFQLGGLLGQPEVNGHAELIAAYLSIRDIGLRLENINLNIKSKKNGQVLAVQGKLNSGKGQVKIDGFASLNAEQGWPVKIDIKGNDFLAINIPQAYAVISPEIQFSQKNNVMLIRGKTLIPEATIAPSTIPEGSVSPSDDIEIIGSEEKTPLNMDLDMTMTLGDKVIIDAFGLKTYLSGEITVKQRPKQIMTARGELYMEKGTFRAYGQDLTIEKGKVFYAGGFLDNPGLDLKASRKVNADTVGIRVFGSAKTMEFDAFSDDPTLTDKNIISMILTGQKSDNLENAKIYAGTEINEQLSVGVNAGAGDEGSEFVTRYSITDDIQLEATSSAQKSGGSILYTIEIE